MKPAERIKLRASILRVLGDKRGLQEPYYFFFTSQEVKVLGEVVDETK